MPKGTILEELAGIRTQLDTLISEFPMCRSQISDINARISAIETSVKSVHHRIDEFKRDVCWTIGTSTTIVGIFASVLTWRWVDGDTG